MDEANGKASQPQAAEPARPPDRWRRLGWLLVGLLLLLEFGLFREFALREIVWGYPRGFDQGVYLARSYEIYEQMLSRGPRAGLVYGLALRNPNGMMLEPQAGLIFLLLGPSRLSALTLNFLYYALLQCAIVATVRWFSGRWSLALFAQGLLIAAQGPFLDVGGLSDFRIDFITWCMFGTLICLVVRSGIFGSFTWSVVVGFAAAWLVSLRFFTSVYLAAISGTCLLVLVAALYLRRGDPTARQQLLRRLRNFAIAGFVLLLLVGPALWARRAMIHDYYVGHNSSDWLVRSRECGVNDMTDRLLYYPRSVHRYHTGRTFQLLAGLAVVSALVVGRFRRGGEPVEAGAEHPPLLAAAGFALACAAIPLTILTLYSSPSPIVGGIIVPALVWLTILAAMGLARVRLAGRDGWVRTGWAGALAALAVLAGFSAYADPLSRRTYLSYNRADVEEVLRLYDDMTLHCRKCNWTVPRLTCNDLHDYLNAGLVSTVAYERHQQPIRVQGFLTGRVGPVAEAEALEAVHKSDIVIMNTGPAPGRGPEPAGPAVYPYLDSMRELRPKMLAACREELVPLGRYRMFGDEVILFARPQSPLTATGAGGAR
jgi:hypothetical protein